MIDRLQNVQNSAARLIARRRKFYHITPVMKELHWLPVSQRIIYKILLITYKALNGLAPSYIRDMLQPLKSTMNLRSSMKGLLSVPPIKLVNYGQRSFSYAAPKLWNELPDLEKDTVRRKKETVRAWQLVNLWAGRGRRGKETKGVACQNPISEDTTLYSWDFTLYRGIPRETFVTLNNFSITKQNVGRKRQ